MRSTNNSRPLNTHAPRSARRRPFALAAGSLTAAVSLLLQGCSSSDPGSDDGPAKLTFLNQSRGQEAALNQLAKQYSKETGIPVTVESPGPADYLPKLQAKAQSRSMPDIYSSFNPVNMAPFYKAGWAMNLEPELKGTWGGDFSQAVIKMSTFAKDNSLGVPAGIYSVHWETQAYGFLIDPSATGTDAKKPPKTTTDLIAALQASDKSGKGNFSVASSLTPQLVQAYASNWLTDDEISATLAGKASWKSDGWRKAFQILLDLKKAGVIANGTIPGGQDDNPTVESSFFNKHDVGAIFDASAGVSVGKKTAPDYTDYFSLSIPAATDGKYEPRSPGVPGKGAVINPRSPHAKEAIAFVKWLTEPAQQKVFAEKANILPTNPRLLDDADAVPAQLTGFAAGIKRMQILPNSFTADVNTAIIRDSQSLVLGEMTVDQVLEDIQSAQERG